MFFSKGMVVPDLVTPMRGGAPPTAADEAAGE